MSRTINRIELLGRVGTDPELRQTRNATAPGSGPGQAVCRLRLATDRRNAGGESQTDWHNLVVWGKTAEAVAEYVQKGDRIYASGRLGYDSWEDQDGQRRQTTEVHANEAVFLDNRNSLPPTRAGGSGNGRRDGDQPFSPDHTISRLCRGARRGRAPTGDAAPLRSHHLKGTRDDRTDRIHRAERRAAGAARRLAPQPQSARRTRDPLRGRDPAERLLDMPTINRPGTVVELLGEEMSRLVQEQVRVLLLDRKIRVVGQRTIYQGNGYCALFRPAEVFRPAVVEAAPQTVVVHNHPSGDPEPSREDIKLSRDLVD